MKILLALCVCVCLASPAAAGPLLESAARRASTVTLAQDQPTYRKSTSRKWLEWVGLVTGVVMATTTEETCFGSLCKTEWHTGIGSTGLALAAVSAVSIALPDPESRP